MNITAVEALVANEEKVRDAAIRAAHELRRSDGHQSFQLSDVPDEELIRLEVAVKAAWFALVDDYTTPGCKCRYCAWKKSDGPRLIMCEQRWKALPGHVRNENGESCTE